MSTNTKTLTKNNVPSGSFDLTDKLLYLDDNAGVKGVAGNTMRTALLDGKQTSQIGELICPNRILEGADQVENHWYRVAAISASSYIGWPSILIFGTSYSSTLTSSGIVAVHKGLGNFPQTWLIKVLSATPQFVIDIPEMRIVADQSDTNVYYVDIKIGKRNYLVTGALFGASACEITDASNSSETVVYQTSLTL